ncbi:MAG: aminopeptidase [Butyrivibrio sp.]|jgi:hypothetical protein|nr:aminopeptidase [Butyrivibrio sp.]
MTLSIGSFILLLCSILTALIVEAIKQLVHLDKPNIAAAIVSVVVGIAVPLGYAIINHIPIDTTAVLYIISIVVLSWLCAMLGFDKVMQTLSQLRR